MLRLLLCPIFFLLSFKRPSHFGALYLAQHNIQNIVCSSPPSPPSVVVASFSFSLAYSCPSSAISSLTVRAPTPPIGASPIGLPVSCLPPQRDPERLPSEYLHHIPRFGPSSFLAICYAENKGASEFCLSDKGRTALAERQATAKAAEWQQQLHKVVAGEAVVGSSRG